MDDSQSVEVLDSQSYLCSIEPGVILGKSSSLIKMEEQISSSHVLCHKKRSVRCLEGVLETLCTRQTVVHS